MPKESRKRPREVSSVNTALVEVYEDLASENGQIRLKAALRLLSAEYDDAELVKILTRLFRGLCSSRKAARLGFSIALTEFLSRYVASEARFSVDRVLTVLKEQTTPAPGATGQELRDYYFGRLFAAEALIKSKVFLQPDSQPSWSVLVDLVLELYYKKQWLREECGWVLQQALVNLRDGSQFPEQVRVVFESLGHENLANTLEGIALWITCPPSITGSRSSSIVFVNSNPLDIAEKPNLLKALKGTVTSDGEDQSKHDAGTTWSSKLHFAWIVIFEAAKRIESGSEANSAKVVGFSDLWSSFVEEHLFANTASEQKKYWGFLMVQYFIKDSTKSSQLLGPNFLRCFCNQLSKSERHLHGIAAKTLKVIIQSVQAGENEHTAGDILLSMIHRNCCVDFDKITKTKFVEKLWAMASPNEHHKCLMLLEQRMRSVKHVNVDRSTAHFYNACADFILTIVKHYNRSRVGEDKSQKINQSNQPDESVISTAVTILTCFAFCQVSSTNEQVIISQQTRSIFQGRLLSALSHLMTQTDDPSTYPAFAAEILLKDTTTQVYSNQAIFKNIRRASKKMVKCAKHMQPTNSAQKANHGNFKIYRAFRLLFALTIIQAFAADADALNVLEDLGAAYDSHLDDNGNVQGGSSSVVEIVLGLISKPSVLFRRVGKEVFQSCAAMVDREGLESMFDILLKRENLAGQQELFDAEDDEEAQEDDTDVEEDSASGVSNDGTSSVTGETVDEEVIEFENKLAEALGTHRAEDELANGDTEESDGEAMDDEQMAALDPLMSNIFKERKRVSHKKESQSAKETIVQFKTKVLELLEIYMQQESHNLQNSILATVPVQCIACIQATKSKQVSEKAAAVVKTALNAYKLSTVPSPQRKILKVAKQELQAVHEHILKPGSNIYLRTCSQASLFLAKVMLNNGATIEKVWKVYSRTGGRMAIHEDVKIFGALFQDWFNWLTSAKLTLHKREASA